MKIADELLIEDVGAVRVFTLNHESRHNPINRSLNASLRSALSTASDSADVEAVVIFGGAGRSFCVGGDFKEMRLIDTRQGAEDLIDCVTELYLAFLRFEKPVVAAIDGYAIGMGFQLAMMCDYRVMADSAELRMPELKHGLAVTMGAQVLRSAVSFNAMRQILFGADGLQAAAARRLDLVNEIVSAADLLQCALNEANRLAKCDAAKFRATKRLTNQPYIDLLRHSSRESKDVHFATLSKREASSHFQAVLKGKPLTSSS